MTLNYNQFLDYVKKNRITLAKTTESFQAIPKGTKLWFGLEGKYLSSFNSQVLNKNREFGYDFDYSWKAYWEIKYTGQFELVEDKNRKFKVGDIVRKIAEGRSVDNTVKIGSIGKITEILYNKDNDYKINYGINYENCYGSDDWLEKVYPITKTIITNIKDAEQHKRVQNKLFEMGCEWVCSGIKIEKYDSKTIQIDINGKMSNDYDKLSVESLIKKYPEYKKYKQIAADEFLGETIKDNIIVDDVFPKSYWFNCKIMEELINKYNQPEIDMPKPIATGSKKIMSNIVNFFNDLTVSAEDKELRKAGLKNDVLSWTVEACEIVLNLEAKERGYKSFQDLDDKFEFDTDIELSTFEYEA